MLEDILRERREKLNNLRAKGVNPYPADIRRGLKTAEALESFDKLVKVGKRIVLVGRIRGLRNQGKIAFIDLEDESGKMQAVVQEEKVKNFKELVPNLDIGDFVGVEGALFKTKRGEKSVEAAKLTLLTKNLRPLPSDYYGLGDTETRLRKRYLDLLMSGETRELFRRKTKFWREIRNFLEAEGFMEVETPVLEATPGGAEAEPFKTHHNALDEDFYLRISLEIALKKLMVAGFERIFEIGRVFRNEGIDAEHLQDYTALEFYYAYADYEDLMKMTEKMYKQVIKATWGTLTFERGGKKINWSGKWEKVDYFEIFKKKSGLDLETAKKEDLFKKAKALGLKPEKGMGKGRLIDLIFKKTARPSLVNPSLLIDPPIEIEPLAKKHRSKPGRVERFQVVAFGTELGKGFSELNDPDDQRERFLEQERQRAAGDAEAQRMDEDFLEALEYGMPPTAGFGLSERLFSVLEGKPIRETVFFPLMRKVGEGRKKGKK